MTNEILKKAKECKTAEELLALAKANGIEMTFGEAEEKLALLHGNGELSDDELDMASGGGCGDSGMENVTIYGKSIGKGCGICGSDCWKENTSKRTATSRVWYCAACEEAWGVQLETQTDATTSFPDSSMTISVQRG